MLHIDLWGAYHTSNLTSDRYFLTILDNFSRVTWIHLLHTKNQVFGIVFFAYIDTHFHQSVKFIGSDNGTEIVHSNCAELFSSRGIVH